jgi:hypothetical protein
VIGHRSLLFYVRIRPGLIFKPFLPARQQSSPHRGQCNFGRKTTAPETASCCPMSLPLSATHQVETRATPMAAYQAETPIMRAFLRTYSGPHRSRVMVRYFFHIDGNKPHHDETGECLPTMPLLGKQRFISHAISRTASMPAIRGALSFLTGRHPSISFKSRRAVIVRS